MNVEPRSKDLMMATLAVAVPMWIQRVRSWSPERRRTESESAAQIVAEKGDVLMYSGKGCAEAFNGLAKGLAILSFAPGGVKFCDERWETKS